MRSTKYHLVIITLVSCVLSGLSDGFQLLVRSTELRCHWWTNGFQLHLLCETQNCAFTVGATAFNYTCCVKHRIALSLMDQPLSITLVWNRELRCHWWTNGFQLHLLCETQNCVVADGSTAFNYTCVKHRIALSLLDQRLSITLVVWNTELRCHWWSNGSQLHLLCETQNCVVTVGATAFNYTCCVKHRIALSLMKQRLSITLVVWNTELRCHCWSNGFQLHLLCEAQNCIVTVGATAFKWCSEPCKTSSRMSDC